MSKQLKISELKRVVNVDEVFKLTSILKDSKSDETQIARAIEQLGKKTPSKEILLKTKLGFILKDITVRQDLSANVRDKARLLRKKWKEFHKNLLLAQRLDVKCDKPTTEQRQNSKNAFKKLINDTDVDEAVYDYRIYELEFAIFQYCDNLINGKYFSIVRRCISYLKEHKGEFKAYLNNEVSTKDLFLKCLPMSANNN